MKRSLILGAALAAAATMAFAQGPGYGPGYGQGRGMMGGQAMMGGGYGLAALNLTDEQREKVAAIQEQHRQKNWAAMGEVRAEQFKLRSLYGADKLDADKIAEQQKKVDGLRQQMLKSRVETHNQIAALLTPEQRKQLRQYSPWWFGGEAEE